MKRALRWFVVGVVGLALVCGAVIITAGILNMGTQPPSAPVAAAPTAVSPTATPVPTNTPRPTELPPTAEPTAPPEPLRSGGMGLTRAQWEGVHGKGTKDTLYWRYGDTFVGYFSDPAGAETVALLELRWKPGLTKEEARTAIRAVSPDDTQFVKAYQTDLGQIVDLFASAWLKDRYQNPDTWVSGEPGQFAVSYHIYDGVVTSAIIGPGNNP